MNSISSFQCEHATILVVLSYVISVFGAYCALQWAAQIPQARGWLLATWVGGAAVAMGGGAIWSMHFIAMMACRLPVSVTYDLSITLASLFVAIVVTGVGLYTVGRGPSSVGRLLAGGLFTGLGVAAMHYTGMAAMVLPANTTYQPPLVAASVLIAIGAAIAALWIAFNMPGGLRRFISSLVMGLAVCGMHYTGMAAAVFVPTGQVMPLHPEGLRPNDLGFMVFGTTLFILVLLYMGSRIIDRKQIEQVLRESHAELERQVAERTAELAHANDGLRAENAERRRAEESLEHERAFLRQVIDINPNFVFAKDRKGRFTLVNQAVADAYGATVEDLIGKTDADFNPNADEVSAFLRADWEVMDSKQERVIPEERITDSGGRARWLQTVKRPIVGRDGQADQILGISTDITDRRMLEEQLLQAQKMDAIGQLAGGIAHDFNNLLTAILVYADLLPTQLESKSHTLESIDEIRKAGERAAGLTRQLLAFSRRQVLEPKVLDVNALILNLEKMLRRLIGEDVELVTDLDPRVGRVRADSGQIEQVLMNLAVNARDAMPKGGKLTIETRNIDTSGPLPEGRVMKSGSYVLISVTDTGIGMSADTRSHMFEPFFTTKERGKGTGLGLATVYGIVKQSQGYIWVVSEPKQGAHFEICLPRVESPLEDLAASEPTEHHVLGTETVLLAEDEDAVRSFARKVLEASGYKVLEADCGEKALEAAERCKDPIGLLLTDVIMPGMSGPELAARLTTFLPRIQVVYMSGYTDDAIVRQGLIAEKGRFLQKPFTADILIKKVKEAVDMTGHR